MCVFMNQLFTCALVGSLAGLLEAALASGGQAWFA